MSGSDRVRSQLTFRSPPNGVLVMVNTLALKTHKSMHDQMTDEEMVWRMGRSEWRITDDLHDQLPIFVQDTDGTPSKGKFIMGRRNWCSVRLEKSTGELSFDIRVERQKGYGETVGYVPTYFRPPLDCIHLLTHQNSSVAVISSRHLHPGGTVEAEGGTPECSLR